MPYFLRANWNVCKIVFTYMLISFTWIFVSDEFIRMLSSDPALFRILSVAKGCFFIIITAVLLYIQITRYTLLIENKETLLEKQNEELTELSIKLCQQLEETQSHEELLKLRNQELNQFAYVVSHDLKAPLRAITNLASWIEEDLKDAMSAEVRNHMALLHKRVCRMENLIEGILKYSRIGRTRSLLEECNVATLVSEVIEDLRPPAGFHVEIATILPTITTDSIHLRQVFANLIDNAIKHHDQQTGNIRISAEDTGNFYQFSVEDDGPGIAPAYHEKIFEIFQVLKPRDSSENTGVGLALVKKIVESQGGKIQVQSQEGQGTIFRFTWAKR